MQDYIALARLHAPLLLIVAPLVTAALVFVTAPARLAWLLACLGSAATALIAVDLAARALFGGAEGAAAQEGLGIGLDAVGAFVASLLAVATAFATVAGGAFLRNFGARGAAPALSAGLVVAGGWISALLARDVFAIFVSAATAWLASIGVVALGGYSERGALNGATRMVALGGVAAALMFLGASMIAAGVGAIDLSALAGNWRGGPGAASAGVGLMAVAFCIYAGIAPLHAWAPISLARGSAYAGLVVAALGVVGALGALARLAIFATAGPALGGGISLALSVLGVSSALIGSIQATGAANLRRLAAYAGAAQGGCILLAIGMGSPAGFEAAFLQLFALAASMFALIGGAAVAAGADLTALDGLGRRAPVASAAIAAGALSLMGAPLTIGFLGRWRLIEAALGVGEWWVAAIVIVVSLAGVFYGGRLIERLYFRRAGAAVATSKDLWRFALTPALVAAIAAVALGLQPILLLGAAERASMLVLGRPG